MINRKRKNIEPSFTDKSIQQEDKEYFVEKKITFSHVYKCNVGVDEISHHNILWLEGNGSTIIVLSKNTESCLVEGDGDGKDQKYCDECGKFKLFMYKINDKKDKMVTLEKESPEYFTIDKSYGDDYRIAFAENGTIIFIITETMIFCYNMELEYVGQYRSNLKYNGDTTIMCDRDSLYFVELKKSIENYEYKECFGELCSDRDCSCTNFLVNCYKLEIKKNEIVIRQVHKRLDKINSTYMLRKKVYKYFGFRSDDCFRLNDYIIIPFMPETVKKDYYYPTIINIFRETI